MNRLWLAGLVVVALVLMAGPALAAEGGERGKRPEGERRGPPRVKITDEQAQQMSTEIQALQDAVAALQAKATEILGDERAARSFVMQTVFAKIRGPGGREGGEKGKREGGKKRGKHEETE